MEWIKLNKEPNDELPVLGDYSVLGHFENGSIETIHVEDFFADQQAGFDSRNEPVFTKWYLNSTPTLTYWKYLPEAPKRRKQ